MTTKKKRAMDYVYYLTIEDVQLVAQDVLDRNLSDDEISGIEDSIAENIRLVCRNRGCNFADL